MPDTLTVAGQTYTRDATGTWWQGGKFGFVVPQPWGAVLDAWAAAEARAAQLRRDLDALREDHERMTQRAYAEWVRGNRSLAPVELGDETGG